MQIIQLLKCNKIINNSIWLITDKAIRLIGGLLVGAWIARYLGPENYGIINFVASFSALFVSFSMLGVDSLLLRELAKTNSDRNILLGTALRIRNIGSFISALLAVLVSYCLYYKQSPLFVMLTALVMVANIIQSLDVISLWYQSRIKSKVVVINKLVAYVIISGMKLLAVIMKAGIWLFVSLGAIENLLGVVFLYLWARFKDGIKITDWSCSKKITNTFLQEGWLLAVNNLCIITFMKADTIILGTFAGSKMVGIYAIAVMISDILYSVAIFACNSAFPKMVELYETNMQKYYAFLKKFFMIMVIYSYVCIVGVYFFANSFVMNLYGNEYILSADIANIHAMSVIFVATGCIRGNMLIIEHKAKYLFVITLLGGMINLALNYYWIPLYGVYGAAYAILLSQIFVCYFSGIFHKGLWKIFCLQTKAFFLLDLWQLKRT